MPPSIPSCGNFRLVANLDVDVNELGTDHGESTQGEKKYRAWACPEHREGKGMVLECEEA